MTWAEVDSWRALRVAVAEEFIEKLPSSMRLTEVAHLLGLTEDQLWCLVRSGRLRMSSDHLGMPAVFPSENRAVLTEEMLLRLESPTNYGNEEANGPGIGGALV